MKFLSLLFLLPLCISKYAPVEVDCPDKKLLRLADGLAPEEQEWLESRNPITKDRITDFLKDVEMSDFDVDSFMDSINDTIKIGIAFSGGGYRAMINGAGQMLSLDDRFEPATKNGLGGLLQSATYVVGLSGGSWLVGSVVLNNYTSIDSITSHGDTWDLSNSIAVYEGLNPFDAYDYYSSIYDAMESKEDAGYDRSITDIWGRSLSYQFFSDYADGGDSLRWSDIREAPKFMDHSMPMPIVVADARAPGTFELNQTASVMEFTPFELGSWDPSLYQFVDVKYLGSEIDDGEVSGDCVNGYDNAGFVLGTLSSLFNQFILQLGTANLPSIIEDVVKKLLGSVSLDTNDVAIYSPNPFKGTKAGDERSIAKNDTLYLVDGGEDLQNVPFQPLIQPEREVDVVFAFDNSGDTDESWPNGTAIITTYSRQFSDQGNGTAFPYVPDAATFRNLNLTAKPTFFGCDSSNLTDLVGDDGMVPPLIVYTANRPFSTWSNTSTFKMSYSDKERDDIITNGFEVGSRLNGTLDDEWPACVGCAIIRRSQERMDLEQSAQCERCFKTYCWNGDYDSESTPGINFTLTGTTNTGDAMESEELPLEETSSASASGGGGGDDDDDDSGDKGGNDDGDDSGAIAVAPRLLRVGVVAVAVALAVI